MLDETWSRFWGANAPHMTKITDMNKEIQKTLVTFFTKNHLSKICIIN
ncbi:hypothetical protein EH5_01766 [Bacillus subtilis]|nr:hypothetical protein EH5_01766 [Bacillus subtilis]